MKYDYWIPEEVVLNCKEQDLEDYYIDAYAEMIVNEYKNKNI